MSSFNTSPEVAEHESPGTVHSVLADINRIRELLTGQLDEYYVAKELLQNADDANNRPDGTDHARAFGLAWSPGITAADHPLLRSPGLVAVNDGPFRPQDAKAIRRMGLGAKGNDDGAIGKFGLGLKSVFAFVEAFFYLAPGDGAGSNWYNPWYESEASGEFDPIEEWDRRSFVTRDQAAMRQFLRDTFGDGSLAEGFAVWLPLRRRSHSLRGGVESPIHSEFPGEDLEWPERLNAEFADRLGFCLPMLSHLERIEVVGARDRQWSVSLEPGSRRLLREFTHDGDRTFAGRVALTGGAESQYVGYERVVPELRQLTRHASWPRRMVPQARAQNIPEKAEPQGAAMFSTRPATAPSGGRLSVDWAVFLPVTEGFLSQSRPLAIEGNLDVALTLHGYWFLAADRRRILPGENWSAFDGEERARREWNDQLLHQATLTQILPALRDFAQDRPSDWVKGLTEALSRTAVFIKHSPDICRHGHWMYRVHQSQRGEWSLEPAALEILELPAPASGDEALPFAVFPRLREVIQTHAVTFASWPRLTRPGKERTRWSDEIVCELLDHADAALICADIAKFDYLVAFVRAQVASQGMSAATEGAVLRLLRRTFRQVRPATLRRLERFPELLAQVGADKRFDLPVEIKAATRDALLALDLDCLLVPGELAGEDTPARDRGNTAQLSAKDAVAVISCLKSDPLEGFVVKVLERCREAERPRLLEEIRTWSLFRIDVLPAETGVLQSLQELDLLATGKRLFSRISPKDARALMGALSAVLREPIALAIPEVGLYLERQARLEPAGAEACLEVLRHGPPFKSTDRIELFKRLNKESNHGPETRVPLRYVLHGDPSHLADEVILLLPAKELNSTWQKVAKMVYGSSPWRLLPHGYAPHLSDEDKRRLSIRDLSLDAITDELRTTPNSSSPSGSAQRTASRSSARRGTSRSSGPCVFSRPSMANSSCPIDEPISRTAGCQPIKPSGRLSGGKLA